MLRHIAIKNFAIIEQVELELDGKLTVLTGETGAGKSILIDALNLALGDRASAEAVRHGADKSDIVATFDISKNRLAQQWLAEHDYDGDEDVLLRRVITSEGRSRAYINGSPTQLGQLKTLGELLIDIHGQHEHQSLIKPEKQRHLLDRYGQHDTATIQSLYKDWHAAEKEYQTLHSASHKRDSELDLLRFQSQELEALNLMPNEAETIEKEHQKLANAGDTIEKVQAALTTLYDTEGDNPVSAHTLISDTLRNLNAINDSTLDDIRTTLNDALAQTQDAADELQHYLSRLDIDPSRLAELEQRMGVMHDLARKHNVNAQELPDLLNTMSAKLEQLDNADFELEKLDQLRQTKAAEYNQAAQTLHKKRLKTASKLAKKITAVMQEVGMPQGNFTVDVTFDETLLSKHGSDLINFLVAANPGQPAKPLGKVASGGELARISLAIQVITAAASDIPSMIFDEVDTGVGGGVAEMVGKTLRQLGESRQTLCVTHLPQVAAQGHNHLQVAKNVTKNSTSTQLVPLNAAQRVEEIARMLGGVDITEQTLAHAKEMLAH